MSTNERVEGLGSGWLSRRLGMTGSGVKNFRTAAVLTMALEFSLMLPVVLTYLFIVSSAPLLGWGVGSGVSLTVWQLSLLGGVFVLLMLLASYYQYRSTYDATYRESANIRVGITEHLRRLPLSFFDKRNTSELTSNILNDVSVLEKAYSHYIPQLFGSLLMVCVMIVGLAGYQWMLAVALLWPIPLAALLFVLTYRQHYRMFKRHFAPDLQVKERIDEGIQQQIPIRTCGLRDEYLEDLADDLAHREHAQERMELFSSVVVNSAGMILRLGMPSLIIVGSSLALAGRVEPVALLFFIIMSSIIYDPLNNAIMHLTIGIYFRTHVERVNAIYAQAPMVGEESFSPTDHSLVFEDVHFSYDADGDPVLHGVSFQATAGEVTALVGRSGSGKSTCARLAARFWDPDRGRVLLGGVDVSGVDPETLLGSYAIVFQDVVLFNTSILENIRLGRRDASDGEVLEAARLAQCDEIASRLPEGYNTEIGENGIRLSGGERQRISIARAILKDAPIVILDEATASQDAENEYAIQRALSALIQDKTVLIIAHRMRTVSDADRIVVLDEGRVVEQGRPLDLYRAGGQFRSMVEAQGLRME